MGLRKQQLKEHPQVRALITIVIVRKDKRDVSLSLSDQSILLDRGGQILAVTLLLNMGISIYFSCSQHPEGGYQLL